METIKITDMIRQNAMVSAREEDSAAAYMVFDVDGNTHLFEYFEAAENFAMRQMENSGDESWDVFPLYAANPLEITD